MHLNTDLLNRAGISLILIFSFVLLSGCHAEKPDNQNEKPKEIFFFAKGVSATKGWHDIEKLKKPEDIMACWLITASNMLQWWQDRYKEAGYELPEGTPDGTGSGPYKSAIFDDAITKFNDLHLGANINAGLLWYVEGKDAGISNHSYPKPGTGGYLKNIEGCKVEYSEHAFTDYDAWANKSENEEALKVFSEKLLEELKRGSAIGMEIKTHIGLGGLLHAITLWGAEVDEKGLITHIYITDSDDYERQLVRCPIEIHDNDFKTKEVAMRVPPGEAYKDGALWAILRLLYIAPPCSASP